MGSEITGLHTNSIASSGVPFSELTATFGPRYRFKIHKKIFVYGQALIGEGNAFDSVLPGATATQTGTNGLAINAGGGIDYRLSSRFAVRVIDASWIRTQDANSTNKQQNDLHLSAGMVVLFGH